MNFSKEYIREADCKEIQGLRPLHRDGGFYRGDWCYNKLSSGCLTLITVKQCYKAEVDIWLPTGDQLDDEIIKIIQEKNAEDDYEISLIYDCTYNDMGYIVSVQYPDDVDIVPFQMDEAPYIAKIKLLKALLKDKKAGSDE